MFLIFLYSFINGYIFRYNSPVTFRFYEFCALPIAYVFFRILESKLSVLSLFAVVSGGLLQIVYGKLQLYGYFPSLHSSFPITGSFFNPGPYSGYLALVFPAAMGLALYGKELLGKSYLKWEYWLKNLGLAVCAGILLVLPATQSRAAWLAVLFSSLLLLFYRYQWYDRFRKLTESKLKRIVSVVIILILLVGISTLIYQLKKDSADGRVLIWKASWGMVVDNPIFGLGYEGFLSRYMDSQAKYFQINPNDQSIPLADNVVYAFNEGLLLLVEQGFIGLVLVGLLIFQLFNFRKRIDRPEVMIAQAGILSLLIFGMFSYPSHILPIKLCGLLYLTFISRHSEPRFSMGVQFRQPILRWGMIPILLLFIGLAGIRFYNVYEKTKIWKEALTMYNNGLYKEANFKFKEVYPYFERDGNFLTNYGKSLSNEGNHGKAILILEEGKRYGGSTIIQTALGDSYKAIGMYMEAEESYLLGVDMLPDRFYAKFLLAKLYMETGQVEKFKVTARTLINKEPKVFSQATVEIKSELRKMMQQIEQI
ncbi:O-antigen ligase family protein [Belliella marina]|uniref:O-antigen ligase family protein n=1 Tax=Belliella marina TaxID=1644146 RepID=A0ABW4VJY6_9BACT